MFKKILIANRGEIACRVIKTARRMGIKTVAVYSEADRDARHVELADEAVLLGPAPSRESYLVADKIIAACQQTGAEALIDGPVATAAMNQPSGLTTDGMTLYVADSEASAIRRITLGADRQITTIVGEGLFDFGDLDGIGPANVRLQHPLGVTWHNGVVYVADTYNHKIKRLDPASGECRTWVGSGAVGHTDGEGSQAQFAEPSDISVANGHAYVVDTNNHAVRVVRLTEATVRTLVLSGLEPPRTE